MRTPDMKTSYGVLCTEHRSVRSMDGKTLRTEYLLRMPATVIFLAIDKACVGRHAQESLDK